MAKKEHDAPVLLQDWPVDRGTHESSRALFSRYSEHVIWRPAFSAFLDGEPPNISGPWIADLQERTPEDFIDWLRGRASQAYSSLSKGVHHEYVVPPSRAYDLSTIQSLLSDAAQLATSLAAVSHAFELAHRRTPIADVWMHLKAAEEEFTSNAKP